MESAIVWAQAAWHMEAQRRNFVLMAFVTLIIWHVSLIQQTAQSAEEQKCGGAF